MKSPSAVAFSAMAPAISIKQSGTRLKDIRELFFDTGIGVDAYSVIEQGRVRAAGNPIRRIAALIFRRTAGISKFQSQEKRSSAQLERVDQNLLRVTDIVEEVEKRLRSVRIQAGRRPQCQGNTPIAFASFA